MMLKEWIQLKTRTKALQAECQPIEVSEELVTMLVAAEDHRFETHSGVDFYSLVRATWRSSRGPNIEGGSTIAMQLVRVLTGHYQRTITRKFIEILFAVGITRLIGKSDLPKMYLMVAYYGWQMNGLKQAALRLNFDPKSTTPIEAAEIVARLKYPEPRYPSHSRLQKISNRANYILQRRMQYAHKLKVIANGSI